MKGSLATTEMLFTVFGAIMQEKADDSPTCHLRSLPPGNKETQALGRKVGL